MIKCEKMNPLKRRRSMRKIENRIKVEWLRKKKEELEEIEEKQDNTWLP